MQRTYRFRDGKKLILSGRTLVMGILNVTPDSFSDGGKWNTRDRALRHMEEMVHDGADIIDIGAESSRPGFVPMGAAEETERLMPFLESVLAECPVPVSVDTFKAETARAALSAGAHLLNDIWGLQYAEEPEEMARAAAEANVPVVVMHNQNGTVYDGDIIAAMRTFFSRSLAIADAAGLACENIILDPGIGFGKTAEQNLQVIKRMDELVSYEGADYPVLLGASRKSFIGAALDLPVEERMEATGAACVLGIARGACIMRVHDVKPIVRMCRVADAILGA
ncbi:dihydropteroate synthase [Selenomonas noxia]|uniref:Dihydropteroate synthase n=1 Tax=Selenomonas noxia F0398 TaxID=702437 RepID=A0ABN0DN76_9FIRM|nr:dihydropteroate synthase [Selenomonas noxia]EHG23574.1 dihydropteroate synthase [Selenomonas noxia F0398]